MSTTAVRVPIRLAASGTAISGKPNPSAPLTAEANAMTIRTRTNAAFGARLASPALYTRIS